MTTFGAASGQPSWSVLGSGKDPRRGRLRVLAACVYSVPVEYFAQAA